ncbi:hypothetical protein AAHE18_17G096700 [Arachis hypogaea]
MDGVVGRDAEINYLRVVIDVVFCGEETPTVALSGETDGKGSELCEVMTELLCGGCGRHRRQVDRRWLAADGSSSSPVRKRRCSCMGERDEKEDVNEKGLLRTNDFGEMKFNFLFYNF